MIKLNVKRGNSTDDKVLQIPLPASDDELNAMTSRDAKKNLVITSIESDIPNLAEKLQELEMFDLSHADKLNSLAERIESLTPVEKEILTAAIEIEPINNYDSLYNQTYWLNEYEYFPNITDKTELGKFLVESNRVQIHESALPYVDYNKVGSDFFESNNIMFTGKGCVVGKDSAVIQNYQDMIRKEIDDSSKMCAFKVSVSSKHLADENISPITIRLPASDGAVNEFMRVMRINNITECSVVNLYSPITALNSITTGNANLEILNNITEQINNLSAKGRELSKFIAAVEIESPADFEAVYEIINNLDNYELMPENVHDCEGYGRYILFDSGEIEDIRDEIENYMNYDDYGKDKMLEEGIRETAVGLLRRIDEPFPEENQSQGFSMNY